MIVHGVEGVGKTSFAANAPKPIVLMARGETGLETLIDANQVKETAHFPELNTWTETLEALDAIANEDHDHRTLVLDTVNGFERLCHEYVCATLFNGDWGKSGFTSYQQGYDASLSEWRGFLSRLDAIRAKRKMAIIGLCHTKIETFKNPEGADYDRFQPDLHRKTWSLTHRWADIVLFANFYTVVSDEVKQGKGAAKGKGAGGTERILLTQRTAAYDAKNRHGLPVEISMGRNGQESWVNFLTAVKGGGQ